MFELKISALSIAQKNVIKIIAFLQKKKINDDEKFDEQFTTHAIIVNNKPRKIS